MDDMIGWIIVALLGCLLITGGFIVFGLDDLNTSSVEFQWFDAPNGLEVPCLVGTGQLSCDWDRVR